jgi:hypothetical protein
VVVRTPELLRLFLLARKAQPAVADLLRAMAAAVVEAVVLESQAAERVLLVQRAARVEQVLRQQCLSTAQPTQVVVAVAEQWEVSLVLVEVGLVLQAEQLRTLLLEAQILEVGVVEEVHQPRF